ncbi:vesicle-associated membrane protein [Corchorus olitorius]|uniref:Vesicle-associated membrane protein n=1 Tax=Corchorus olitorius TaxID=93759 RepID=A0A1R3IR25_9ROSI|nr:vesicle-associated membrane protein [Corchorus olitorius]
MDGIKVGKRKGPEHDGCPYSSPYQAHCIVTVESAHSQIRVRYDFNKKYGGGKVATATANSLNREFGGSYGEKDPAVKGLYNFLMDSAMSPIALEASGFC